jgi:hypothetical protein
MDAIATELDFSAFYRVKGSPGSAWTIRPLMVVDGCDGHEDPDHPDGGYYCDEPGVGCLEERQADDAVIAVMVGDDRKHEIEVSELEVIGDDEFCRSCGQIGCGHNTYE